MTEGTGIAVGSVVAWSDVPDGALVWRAAATHHELDAAWVRRGDIGHRVAWSLGWGGRGGGPVEAAAVDFIWRVIEPYDAADRRRRSKVVIVALGLTGQETAADLERISRDFERNRILAHLRAAACIGCGGKPVVCYGTAEGNRLIDPMCDECCGHGNEDGWCTMPRDEDLTSLAAQLAEVGFKLTDDAERMYKLLHPETDE